MPLQKYKDRVRYMLFENRTLIKTEKTKIEE